MSALHKLLVMTLIRPIIFLAHSLPDRKNMIPPKTVENSQYRK